MLPLKLVDNSLLAALVASGGWLLTWPPLGVALYIQSLSPPSSLGLFSCLSVSTWLSPDKDTSPIELGVHCPPVRILNWFAVPFSRGPRFVRTLHDNLSFLVGPTQHHLVPLS